MAITYRQQWVSCKPWVTNMTRTSPVSIHLFDDSGTDFLFKGMQLAKLTSRTPGFPPHALTVQCHEGEKAFYAWVVEKSLAHPTSGVCHTVVCHSTQRMPDRPLETRCAFRCLSLVGLLATLEKEYRHTDLRQQFEKQLKNNDNTSAGLEL
jgi:hypothetical protein